MPDKRRVLLDVLDLSGMVTYSDVCMVVRLWFLIHTDNSFLIQEAFQAMIELFLRTTDGVMLVYDSQERDTFSSMEDTCRKVYQEKGDHYPIVLVGHYSDDTDCWVAYEEGQQLAKGLGCPFFVVSAATGENIPEAFYELIRIMALSDPEVLVRPDDCSGECSQRESHHFDSFGFL